MSVGRVSTFLDIYIERDLANGTLTEVEAQELVDHMTMKFRMVKFARIESYNQLFSGDPVWATVDVAGIGMDGRSHGNEDMSSVSFIHWKTWDHLRSQTLLYCILLICRRHLRNMHLTFPSRQVPYSMKMMM